MSNGYLPRTGDVFDFLTAGNLLNFSNLHFGVIGGVGGFSISPNMGVNGSIEFVAQTNFYVSEPTTITLFSFGLFGIGLSRRRTQPLSRVATLLKFKLIK
jgi:hypothetical protein